MKAKPTIAHSVTNFLFLTGSWIYNLLINADKTIPIVFAEHIENEQIFPFDKLYSERNFNKVGSKIFSLLTHKFGVNPLLYKLVISHFERVKLLHSHFGNRGYYDIELAKKLKVPHIVTFYGYDAWRLPKTDNAWKNRYRELFQYGDLFLVEGPFMLKRLIELGCDQHKAKVQRIGIDLNTIEFIPRSIKKDGIIKILIAGTFTEKKGIPYALDAIGQIKDKHPNIRVVIMGDSSARIPDSIEEKGKILDVIKKHSMESIIEMVGYQPYSYLLKESKKCHLFFSPSIHAKNGDSEGGSPVIITEMSAAGMPILSTYHCDIPEVVLHGQTGLLSNEKDIEGMMTNLEYLISNPHLWIEMGKNGRKHIEKEFDLLRQVKKLEHIYLKYI